MIEEDAKDRVDTRRWITCCGKKKIKKILEAGVSPEQCVCVCVSKVYFEMK